MSGFALRNRAGEVPYVVAIIELAEGPRMISNIVGTPFDRIKIRCSLGDVVD